MNKSMLMGLVGGISIATAGGVAAYALLSPPAGVVDTGSAAVVEDATAPSAIAGQEAEARLETAAPVAQPSRTAAAPAPAPQPARAVAAPAPAPATVAQAPVAAQAPAAEPECWDEEVTVPADPKDEKAIAGTAAGAVLGGALAKKLGDDHDLLTAAGAAAGALAGRKLQRHVQENNTVTTTERRCAPAE